MARGFWYILIPYELPTCRRIAQKTSIFNRVDIEGSGSGDWSVRSLTLFLKRKGVVRVKLDIRWKSAN